MEDFTELDNGKLLYIDFGKQALNLAYFKAMADYRRAQDQGNTGRCAYLMRKVASLESAIEWLSERPASMHIAAMETPGETVLPSQTFYQKQNETISDEFPVFDEAPF